MGYYKDQSDMFDQRAESNKKSADQHYSQAMDAKEEGDEDQYQEHIVQAKHYYKSAEENERKAEEHKGKSF